MWVLVPFKEETLSNKAFKENKTHDYISCFTPIA